MNPEAGTGSITRSSGAVVLIRVGAATLQLLFTVFLVAVEGAERAGVVLAGIAIIELAALVGRLGLPTLLTRTRSNVGAGARLPMPLLMVAATNSVVAGIVLGLGGIQRPLLAVGAAAVALNFCFGWWQRGASRFVMAALAHPVGPVGFGLASLAFGVGDPLSFYVLGTVATTVALAAATVGDWGSEPRRLPAVAAGYLETAPVGLAEIGNLLALRGIPILLVAAGEEETAAVFDLAVKAYRPLLILQFAFTFILGPALARDPTRALTAEMRRRLDLATGLMQLSLVPYAAVTVVLVEALARGFLVGSPLPDLTATWLVLFVGHAAIVATGPTGQLLVMRNHDQWALRSALAGAVASILFYLIPFEPWLRAAGALSLGFAVQSLVAAYAARRTGDWVARPSMAARAARR